MSENHGTLWKSRGEDWGFEDSPVIKVGFWMKRDHRQSPFANQTVLFTSNLGNRLHELDLMTCCLHSGVVWVERKWSFDWRRTCKRSEVLSRLRFQDGESKRGLRVSKCTHTCRSLFVAFKVEGGFEWTLLLELQVVAWARERDSSLLEKLLRSTWEENTDKVEVRIKIGWWWRRNVATHLFEKMASSPSFYFPKFHFQKLRWSHRHSKHPNLLSKPPGAINFENNIFNFPSLLMYNNHRS